MARFAQRQPIAPRGVLRSSEVSTRTHEGGAAFVDEPFTQLFLAASTTFLDKTFYEDEAAREQRIRQLAEDCTRSMPDDVAGLAAWLRTRGNLRSVPIVVACAYVAAGGPNGRAVIASVLQRADEPAELIHYWRSAYKRSLPKAVKKGVADAVARLYDERAVAKWDSPSRPLRFADVIELVFQRPAADDAQSRLFKYLLDERHHGDGVIDPELMPNLAEVKAFHSVPTEQRRAWLKTNRLPRVATWEDIAGWYPHETKGTVSAVAWGAAIPRMGVMALVKNLRNFDIAGIDAAARQQVIAKITNPDDIRASQVFPFRFLQAWKELGSMHWGGALEQALAASIENVPSWSGRTLVLLDGSGSMQGQLGKTNLCRFEVAQLFAITLALRSAADVIAYSGPSEAVRIDVRPSDSVLRHCTSFTGPGRGTHTWSALAQHYDPARHDRVVILTDGQVDGSDRADTSHVRPRKGVMIWDLAGYGNAMRPGFIGMGGFNDAAWSVVPLRDWAGEGRWPWAG